MSKLISNGKHNNKVVIPLQTIKELGWNKETKLDIKRVGSKIVIKQADSK
jgi:bifunctional DNA-binding transcriptional regulator/antitoxin component of YhaV-PrlF toxin-antitoxin module